MDKTNLDLRISNYYEGASLYQTRRHEEWRENYSLYRDKTRTNRFTQRQSVNIPLMKETIKTVLSRTDDFPDMYFESLSGDKQKEIFWNEYWKWNVEEDNLEIKDVVDKKQEGLYGISTMKLNIWNGRVMTEVLEPYDVIWDRYTDPSDIDNSCMYMCHRNIFRSLSSLESNPFYDKVAIGRLRTSYATSMGLKRSQENLDAMIARDNRLQDLGEWDSTNPKVGETWLEVREHYVKLWDAEKKELRINVRVTADNETLAEKPLDEILAINFFPFETWSDDVERTDMYPDGLGDIVRTPNKIVNSFFSSMIENQLLQNYGMTFYDATASEGDWIPQTYEPAPWAWIPTPGDPNKTTKRVEIGQVGSLMQEISFITGVVERATASTATEKGVKEDGQVTLGQLKFMLQSSTERLTSIGKFYRRSRQRLGKKFYLLAEANADKLKAVELFKKSYKDKYFNEKVKPSDWKDSVGYRCRIISSSEREQKTVASIQKLKIIVSEFPENVPLKLIYQKRLLDLGDLSPEESDEVIHWEEEARKRLETANTTGVPAIGTPPPVPSPFSNELPPVEQPSNAV